MLPDERESWWMSGQNTHVRHIKQWLLRTQALTLFYDTNSGKNFAGKAASV